MEFRCQHCGHRIVLNVEAYMSQGLHDFLADQYADTKERLGKWGERVKSARKSLQKNLIGD